MIRELTESDIGFVAELERICFSGSCSEQSIRDSFSCDNNYFFIAEEDNKPVGYIELSVAADEGYIYNIAVLPEYRKKGIGEALTRYVCELFCDLSFITLEVRPSNTAAVNLYSKLGFEKVGERKNYYRKPEEDALLMTKYN